MTVDVIEGQILLLTAAKASVPPDRLPELVERAGAYVERNLERYRRKYECVFEGDDRAAFFVEWGHWDEVGDELGFSVRERSAVRRAHEEQLRRIGRREDREAEFETALEIRDPVLVATGVDEP